MFKPAPSSKPVSADTAVLAADAKKGQLVVCVGAGISFDAGLPGGGKLGELLDASFRSSIDGYVPPAEPWNLLNVADAAAALVAGEDALRREVLELAPFTRIRPGYTHLAIACLLVEGAMTVISWNWDTCIERARPREDLQVAHSKKDLDELDGPQLLKVHGCASRVETLLVTSRHLENPPAWTSEAFERRFSYSKMVFVGIGDVADYAERRIQEMVAQAPDDAIRVVSPKIDSEWATNRWSTTTPNLPPERRIGKSGEDFFDELSRAWVQQLRKNVLKGAAGFVPDQQAGTDAALRAFGFLDAVGVVQWLREATMEPQSGESVVHAGTTAETVIAIGLLTGQGGTAALPSPAVFEVDGKAYEVLMTRGNPLNSDVRRELTFRAELSANAGRASGPEITFLVGGRYSGKLDAPAQVLDDVYPGDDDFEDIFSGPLATRPTVVNTADLLAQTV